MRFRSQAVAALATAVLAGTAPVLVSTGTAAASPGDPFVRTVQKVGHTGTSHVQGSPSGKTGVLSHELAPDVEEGNTAAPKSQGNGANRSKASRNQPLP